MLVEDQQELGLVGLADFAKAAEQSPDSQPNPS
jgi:hypothetical protein